MMRYSYKIELLKLESKIKALELQLFNSFNLSIFNKLEELKKERDWFKEKIEKGEDPGVMIL